MLQWPNADGPRDQFEWGHRIRDIVFPSFICHRVQIMIVTDVDDLFATSTQQQVTIPTHFLFNSRNVPAYQPAWMLLTCVLSQSADNIVIKLYAALSIAKNLHSYFFWKCYRCGITFFIVYSNYQRKCSSTCFTHCVMLRVT